MSAGIRLATLALAGLFPAAAVAQVQIDPMEQQRCVWSCLANSTGNTDPAYNACVERLCTEEAIAARAAEDAAAEAAAQAARGAPANATPAPPAATAWATERDGSGGLTASAFTPGGDIRLTYACGLVVLDFPNAIGATASSPVVLTVDGSEGRALAPSAPGAVWRADVRPDDPLIAALRGGRDANLSQTDGTPMGSISLAGSSRAIAAVLAACPG